MNLILVLTDLVFNDKRLIDEHVDSKRLLNLMTVIMNWQKHF